MKKGRQQIIDWLEIWNACAQRIIKCFQSWYYLQKKKKFLKGVKALQKILLGQSTRWQLRALLNQVEDIRSRIPSNKSDMVSGKTKYMLDDGGDIKRRATRSSIAIYVKNYITAFTSGSYTVLDSSKVTSMDLLHDMEVPLSSTLFDTAGIAQIRKTKPSIKSSLKADTSASGIFEMTSPHELSSQLEVDDKSYASTVTSSKIMLLSKLDFQSSKAFASYVDSATDERSDTVPRPRKFHPHANALIQSRRFEVS